MEALRRSSRKDWAPAAAKEVQVSVAWPRRRREEHWTRASPLLFHQTEGAGRARAMGGRHVLGMRPCQ